MPWKNDYIPIRKALKNYLKEQGIMISDILSLMDEEKRYNGSFK